MKIEPGVTKRTVIALWCASVSGFLYFFSASMNSEISFMQFMNFSILLFGGGVAYHVTTELLSCPQTTYNHALWKVILIILSKTLIGYAIAGVSLYLALKFNSDWSWILAFTGLVLGYLWIMHYIFKLNQPIRDLITDTRSEID